LNISKHTIFKYIFILLLPLCYQSLLADEHADDDNTYLNVARTQLDIAFENYNKGDITASKQNLKNASEWLYKAEKHSRSETVKVEAQKLAASIDSFRLKLNKSSEKNDMARFWHRATSLLKRESEHLIHSYTESSTKNKVLRYLLDAKMHFYNADHDLFISHDSNNANLELRSSQEYLAQAESLAKSKVKKDINHLITRIDELMSLSGLYKNAWKQDTLVSSLEKAINSLSEAESVASPHTRLQLEIIKQTISKLKKETLKRSLKTKYDEILTDFSRAINNI